MFNLSDFNLEPGFSRHYFRLSLIIHGFALYILWLSDFSTLIQVLVSIGLVYQMSVKPALPFMKLEYRDKNWLLWEKETAVTRFQTFHILLDTGLFFIIQFKSGRKRKKRVIFYDQIEIEAYRNLRRFEKIQNKTLQAFQDSF